MSIVDRAIAGLPSPSPWMHFQAPLNEETIALSVPDALVAVILASVWADSQRNTAEATRLSDLLSTSRVLRRATRDRDSESAGRTITLLAKHGRPAVLAACVAAIPPDMRGTAFANAVDIVFADGNVDEREKAYLDELQQAFGIEDGLALKIVEVLAIKNRL